MDILLDRCILEKLVYIEVLTFASLAEPEVNRYFGFSATQIKAVIILAGVMLLLSSYRIVRSFAVAEATAPAISFQAASPDLGYAPIVTVDLNRTPVDSLELLPGIGPTLAERIVAYRDSLGGFGTIDEVMKVEGIGRGTFERIQPYLEVTPW